MSTQFDRRWRVQVEDLVTEDQRCVFKAHLSLKAEPNKVELAIYNLSRESRQRITPAKGKTVRVQIDAGYKDEIGTVFVGDAGTVYPVRQGADMITKVLGSDGGHALNKARFADNFGPGTKLVDVLEKMAGSLGLKADAAKERIRKGDFRGGITEFAHGFNFAGPLRAEFDRQMKSAGLTWSVQKGELQILAESETTQQTAFVFSSDSGLIGSPELKDGGGVKFQCLMQAALSPGLKVVLDAKAVQGTFKVTELVFSGDTHGQDWLVDVEAVPA